MNSSEITKKIKAGDIDAFGVIFRNHYPRLINYCKLFIKEIDIAEDLVQETFVSFWEKRAQIDETRSVNGLLYVSLRNRCLNYIKHTKSLQANNKSYKAEIEQVQYLTHIDYLDQEELSLEERLLQDIDIAIEKLPQRCKIIFKKSRFENLKNREIAKQLGISTKAVEKQLSVAKEKIISYVSTHYPTETILLIIFFIKQH